jgi:hypothetical protein
MGFFGKTAEKTKMFDKNLESYNWGEDPDKRTQKIFYGYIHATAAVLSVGFLYVVYRIFDWITAAPENIGFAVVTMVLVWLFYTDFFQPLKKINDEEKKQTRP